MTETCPQNRRLGYARVSTSGQTLDTQLEQLRGAGCTKIFREKVTGAHSDRRQLFKMLGTLAPGDVVTVTCIDRLARSTFDLFAIVKDIVDAQGAILFTSGAVGRHRHQHRAFDDRCLRRIGGRGTRPYPHARTAEGRTRAQKRGQHMGRPPKLTAAQKTEARQRRAQGATLAELARSYGVGKSTISRLTG
jgi:DNA invertase Pin-like site-specific DNA recombinase